MHAIKDNASKAFLTTSGYDNYGKSHMMLNDTSVTHIEDKHGQTMTTRNSRIVASDMVKKPVHGRNGSLPGVSKTLLSNAGANIMKGMQEPPRKVEVKSNFLRRGEG